MEEWKDFRWFVGIIVLLWVAWFITGGTSRYDAKKPYVDAPKTPGDSISPVGPNKR